MFDVFYTNQKPYLFPFEKPAKDLADAKAQCRTGSFWLLDGCCDYTDFDFEWRPDPGPAYMHAWGNQWVPAEYRPCVTFVAEGATEYKFMSEVLHRLPNYGNQWRVNFNIEEFDYSWEPNPFDPPMDYVFGNQWNPGVIQPTIIYKVEGATEVKYIDDIVAKLAQNNANWVVIKDEVDWKIDKSWVPNPCDPPFIYVFGNSWYSSVDMPTVEYRVPGAVDYKYCDEVIVTKPAVKEYWQYNASLDITELDKWAPNPYDPPYIYVFGNQHYAAQVMPTAEYMMPGATELKYVDDVIAKLLPNKERWSIPEEVDASAIDFSWVPHPKDEPYVHHFGSEFQVSVGLTYTVPGATEPKFEGEPPLLAKERKAVQVLDIFYMDKSNFSSAERYRKLLEKYPNAQKIRYVNSNLETIQRCIAKAKTSKFWVISSENVYDDFNFEWHAQPWQSYMTHVFGSQWEKWSDTFLINKWEFERHTKWAKTLAEFPNLNFVKDQYVKTGNDNFDMYYVDHGNPDDSLLSLKSRYPRIKVTRFVDNLLDALRRIMNTTTSEYVWVTSSLCNYGGFDFTWTPEPWQAEMIHCFGTRTEKRGDTFYIHVESFKKQMTDLELLDWFNVICYHSDDLLQRYDSPVVYYDTDNLIEVINNHQFVTPYVTFTNVKGYTPQLEQCLWSQKDRKVLSATPDNGVACVPRDIKQYLKTQIYDYPYIDKTWNKALSALNMDVIFISYDETDADANWEILKAQYPSAQRLHGVEGMDNALKKAAEMSSTHWYYAVFAKTIIDPSFNFTFQPDLFQQPKHYIFHAHNPMNGLEYGHMGIVMYNCNIVKNMSTFGIDYTMSAAHEVVPIVSAVAAFNTTPYQTWRTAFREVAKLSQFNDESPTIENSFRLKTWTTKAEGEYAEWCLQGAKDAVTFYSANSHDKTQLKQAFDWVWLKQYFVSLHGEH
jgi:hypothetical protein